MSQDLHAAVVIEPSLGSAGSGFRGKNLGSLTAASEVVREAHPRDINSSALTPRRQVFKKKWRPR